MKVFKIILIIISLIWTIMNFIAAVTSPTVVNLTSFIAIIPIITGLYSEIDWLYINWNKIRAYLFLKTVSFTLKSSRYISQEETIESLECHTRNCLKKNKYSIKEAFVQRTHEDLYFDVINNGFCSKLRVNIHNDSTGTRLTIKMEYQSAYRDVSQFWKEFLLVRNDFFAQFSILQDTKERYDVTINTTEAKEYSPFYRLTVKHVGKYKINKFNLKFSDDKLRIETSMNKIYGSSENYQDIEKMIKEYIPISRLT